MLEAAGTERCTPPNLGSSFTQAASWMARWRARVEQSTPKHSVLPWDSELAWCSQSGKSTSQLVRVVVCQGHLPDDGDHNTQVRSVWFKSLCVFSSRSQDKHRKFLAMLLTWYLHIKKTKTLFCTFKAFTLSLTFLLMNIYLFYTTTLLRCSSKSFHPFASSFLSQLLPRVMLLKVQAHNKTLAACTNVNQPLFFH